MSGLKLILITLVLTFLIVPYHFSAMSEEPIATESISDKILALQKKRIELLQKGVGVAKVHFENGSDRATLETYHSAQLKLLNSQFELATTNKEKIEILQAKLKIAKKELSSIEVLSSGGFAGGEANRLFEKKSNTLGAELQLLKFQQSIQGSTSLQENCSSGKIQELETQRIDALQKAVDAVRKLYERGSMDISIVHGIQLKLLGVQLDIAKTNKEKIELIQAQLKIAKGGLRLVEAKREIGVQGGEADKYYRAKAFVLHFEIPLRKLQQLDEPMKWKNAELSLQDLQLQQIETLQNSLEIEQILLESGVRRSSLNSIQSIQEELLNAQIDFAKSIEEKTEYTQVQLDIAKERANYNQRVQNITGGKDWDKIYQSQAFALQLEIQLLKLQQLDKKPKTTKNQCKTSAAIQF
ncbi:MAG: hypothetical protein COA78_31205 [Blastopirellula sp.]|nr:MAG: hypothetical protein COA78_31205 [Blastopirellula sp.]